MAWRNLAVAWCIRGALDIEAARLALQHVTSRHEILRTSLRELDGSVVQLIVPQLAPVVEIVDLRSGRGRSRSRAMRAGARARLFRAFDLTRPPLWRAMLVRMGMIENVLLLVVSHTVWDAYSTSVFARDFSRAYGAVADGTPPLPELELQLGDLAQWEESVRDPRMEAFWAAEVQERCRGVPLRIDRRRASTRRYAGNDLELEPLPPHVGRSLAQLACELGTTVAVTLMGAFAVLLVGDSEQDQVVIGVDEANRDRPETSPLIGNLLNVIPVTVRVPARASFREIVGSTATRWAEAYAHRLPLRRIAALHEQYADEHETPLYEVTLNVRPHDAPVASPPGSSIALVPWQPPSSWANFSVASVWWRAHLDLSIDLGSSGGLAGQLSYNREAIDDATAVRLTQQLRWLLRWVAQHPDRELPRHGGLPEPTRAASHGR